VASDIQNGRQTEGFSANVFRSRRGFSHQLRRLHAASGGTLVFVDAQPSRRPQCGMFPDLLSSEPNPERHMGGKPSNQYQFDPAEGRTSDHKRLPEEENINEEDRQKYEATKERGESKHIPERKTNPALQGVRDRNDKRGE
jgi:hypothetical protein